ncbi:cell wall-binding repeat-containing protein [Desulfosporosinus sp. OT]|uniref:cell wall-binding repeat-containing protein n=1 Tax=Desulfosporosinus sp. OT TaxID=913865 RepID=UPI000223A1A5|nr:cell wall-binding repeat-containing protein [Desulfosporosinus sp. OT]EGW37952.1 cell wall binding repeat 2 family protein [Desulfosporosinus sp. OT]
MKKQTAKILLLFILILTFFPTADKALAKPLTTTNIILSSDHQQYHVGDTVTVDLKSQSEVHIAGVSFTMNWDNSILQNISGLKYPGFKCYGGYKEDDGTLTYPLVNDTSDETVLTSEIAQISFKVLKSGTATVNLSNIKAIDSNYFTISQNVSDQISLDIGKGGTTSGGTTTGGTTTGGTTTGGTTTGGITTGGTTTGGSLSTSSPNEFQRLAGLTSLDTAIAIAKEQFRNMQPDAVVIATANNFPDALSGSGLAYKYNAPLLLVRDSVHDSQSVLDYITSNLSKSKTIYVLGGQQAVKAEITDYLQLQGYKITRLYGKDCYDTNQQIVNQMNVAQGTPVVIATGAVFADALSISSIAAIKGYPLLLSEKDNLSANVNNYLAKIQPKTVYIIGGTGVLSANIEAQIKGIVGNAEVIRLGGIDRFETSMMILDYFKLTTEMVTLATGLNFPDALSGSVLAARENCGVLLIDNKDVTKQKEFLINHNLKHYIIFGGETVISEQTATSLLN